MTKFCASLKGYFKIHESNTLQIAWERTAMKFFCRIMIDLLTYWKLLKGKPSAS